MTNTEFKAQILPQIDAAILDRIAEKWHPETHYLFTVSGGSYRVMADREHLEKFRAKVMRLPSKVGDPKGPTPSSRMINLSPAQRASATKRTQECHE